MTLAFILVLFAAITLILILRIAVSRSLQLSKSNSLSPQIEPIDIDAFRNLIDAAESKYLYRRLPPGEFRRVQRERLRAAAAYIRVAGRNAAVLVTIGQTALTTTDPQTAEAAHQLIDRGLLLRRNATLALLRIYLAMAWPQATLAISPVLNGYERLSSSAMLLGRLQNPAVPVRISVRP
jgi:hypothetical protein